jgi:glycine dehydrogenase
MMGGDGLTNATKYAILNANYIKERLSGHYDVLYTGTNGRCAHEMILDCRSFKVAGVEAEDLGKTINGLRFPRAYIVIPGCGYIDDRTY